MTDKDALSDQPKKDALPSPPSSPAEADKSTQPPNLDAGVNQKPVPAVDSEAHRLLRMLINRKQTGEITDSAEKARSAPASPALTQPEQKEPSAAQSVPSPNKTPTPPEPVTKDAGSSDGKTPAWPEPAKTLGGPSPSGKLDPAPALTPTVPSPTGKPDQAPTPAPPAPRESISSTPGTGTARLNRPPADLAARATPVEASPVGSGLLRRRKVDPQAAIRTTSATRNVPKGRVAQEVWKVIFQGIAGSQVKELGVEVKGLSVVGRTDPDGVSKADLDLTPFNAGVFGVSRQHVILVPTEEGPCIIDMNSTNGTWINGLYLEPGRRYRLRTNDRVELGTLKLLVRVMTPAEQGASAASSDSQSAAGTIKKTDSP